MLGAPQSAAAGAQHQKGTSDGDVMAQVEAFVRVQKRTPAERARDREREQEHAESYVLGSEVVALGCSCSGAAAVGHLCCDDVGWCSWGLIGMRDKKYSRSLQPC
jgi:hypothetical protein